MVSNPVFHTETAPAGESLPLRTPALDPMAESQVVDPETVQALVAAGFTAIELNMVDEGEKLFRFLETIRPGRDFVALGRGMAALAAGRLEEAIGIFQDAVTVYPEHPQLRAFHVLALTLSGDFSAARDHQVALAHLSTDPGMVRFSECLQNELSRRTTLSAGSVRPEKASAVQNQKESEIP